MSKPIHRHANLTEKDIHRPALQPYPTPAGAPTTDEEAYGALGSIAETEAIRRALCSLFDIRRGLGDTVKEATMACLKMMKHLEQ